MKARGIPYRELPLLQPLVKDYLAGKSYTQRLAGSSPGYDAIRKVIRKRLQSPFSERELLVKVLKRQHTGTNISGVVNTNIEKLRNANTFTVTTGHQLNLFTGPLYFVYKILTVIRAANDFNERYPEYHFVPVYWMATEDHDFEEINHTWIFDRKISWDTEQKGFVGEFDTSGIFSAIEQLAGLIGGSIQSDELIGLMRKAYLENANLADATRWLVNEWFGKYGLVVIDGNDLELKRLFRPAMKRELLEQITESEVTKTIKQFPKGIKPQVKPREINLFYGGRGLRERIVRKDDGYAVLNTGFHFSREEILAELNEYPDRFSPNVLLRPVYQETILPNIAYYGGGAEVAYWLELKSLFEVLGVPYPVVMLRNSFLILGKGTQKRLADLHLEITDVFTGEDELVRKVLSEKNPLETEYQDFEEKADRLLDDIHKKLSAANPDLGKSFDGIRARVEKQLSGMEKKIFKAFKKQHEEKVAKIKAIKGAVFPGGVLQERRLNVIEFLLCYGNTFFDLIRENSTSFPTEFTVLEE